MLIDSTSDRVVTTIAEKLKNWGGRTRTSNFLINSQAVCQLTYTPKFAL